VFERLTDGARSVLLLGFEESLLLNHAPIGTEHLLLGLIREAEGVAAKALASFGLELKTTRERVKALSPRKTDPAVTAHQKGSNGWTTIVSPSKGGPPAFTPKANEVLELSLREADQLGHSYVGTEHILLGLVREGGGIGAQVLQSFGVELPQVRERVQGLLSG
jgi:ATP-dependent Clp protease ATP-binding subunit ClpC